MSPAERDQHRDGAIQAFWDDARIRAKLNRIEVYAGPGITDTVPPPAWSFGSDPATADRLLALVLDGRKTATASALRDYEQEARAAADRDRDPEQEHAGGDTLVRTELDLLLPEPGMLSILLDGRDRPKALIRVSDVQVVRFADVPPEHALREGEDDRTLRSWQHTHRRFFEESAGGQPVDDDTLVVLEHFEVLVPAAAQRAARRNGIG